MVSDQYLWLTSSGIMSRECGRAHSDTYPLADVRYYGQQCIQAERRQRLLLQTMKNRLKPDASPHLRFDPDDVELEVNFATSYILASP
jgi:hypothetical protein